MYLLELGGTFEIKPFNIDNTNICYCLMHVSTGISTCPIQTDDAIFLNHYQDKYIHLSLQNETKTLFREFIYLFTK